MANGDAMAAARLTVVRPGEGPAGDLGDGIGVAYKIDGEHTGGALSIVEHPFAVGALVPPHVHTLEDEVSIVLEGRIGFRSNDQEVVLGPGGYIVKPRGELHAMWNAGDVPARMIEIITPAGLEQFFRGIEVTPAGPPDEETIMDLVERQGLSFDEPEWLPGIVARFGLTLPPG